MLIDLVDLMMVFSSHSHDSGVNCWEAWVVLGFILLNFLVGLWELGGFLVFW